jgi:hypothetical protein
MTEWFTAATIVIGSIMFVWFLSWLILEFGPGFLLEILIALAVIAGLIVIVHSRLI